MFRVDRKQEEKRGTSLSNVWSMSRKYAFGNRKSNPRREEPAESRMNQPQVWDRPSIVVKVKDGHDAVIPVAGDLIPIAVGRELHNAQGGRIDDDLRWSQVVLIIADNLDALGKGHRFHFRIGRVLSIRRLGTCQTGVRETQRKYCAQATKNYFITNPRNNMMTTLVPAPQVDRPFGTTF